MRKLTKRFLSWLLVIAIMFSDISVMAKTKSSESATQDSAVESTDSDLKEPQVLYEITEKRDPITKHFAMSDGSTKAYIYPQTVHYLDEGKYEEIDNTLHAVTEGGKNYFKNKKNSFQVKIPESFGEDYIEFSDENGYVKFKLLGATNKKLEKLTKNKSSESKDITIVKHANDKAIFKSIKGDVDIEYDVAGNKLKETIVLYKKTKNSFIFDVQTTAAKAVKNEDNSISFYNADDTEIYTMESPYMVDANGEYSHAVETTLVATKTGYTLTYVPDYEWLAAKERVYPVKIDPTLLQKFNEKAYIASAIDTYVASYQNQSEERYGYTDVINVGRRASSQFIFRGFIKFAMPAGIGKNDCIVDATLDLVHYTEYTSVNGTQIDLYELTSAFTESGTWWGQQPGSTSTIASFALVNTNNTISGTGFSYDTYNITRLVDNWHNGSANHGMMLKLHDESTSVSSTKQVFYFAQDSRYYGTVSKFVEITYRNTTGLEDYWSYTTQGLGQSGAGYVNNYNGNLIYTHDDATFNSLINGFTLSHVYNSCNTSKTQSVNQEMGHYGAGWNLNLFQKFETASVTGNSSVKFKYTDGDGTEHYFVQTSDGKIVDEDGLGYTYKDISEGELDHQITDKNGTVLKFDSFKNLRRIIDANGNTINLEYLTLSNGGKYLGTITTSSGGSITLTYDSNYNLSTITDNAQRQTEFRYTSGNLTEIEYPDGRITRFEYQTGTHFLQKVTAPDGKQYCYGYNSANHKVTSVQFKDANGTALENHQFEYKHNQTKVTDVTGKFYTYQFDTFGRVTQIYDQNNNVCTQKFTANSTTGADIFRNNKVATVSNTATYINNLVDNGCFYNDFTGWSIPSGSTYHSISTDYSYFGTKSAKMVGNGDSAKVVISTPPSKAGKTYTLSAYIRYENITGLATHGAGMEIYTTKNRWATSFRQGSSDPEVNNGFERVTTTIHLAADETIVRIAVGNYYCTGTVYVDGVQLEEGDTANAVNLLSNSSFEKNSGVGSVPSSFTNNAGYGVTTSNAKDGQYSFRIDGTASAGRWVTQTVKHSGKAGDVFTYGAWAKADSIPAQPGSQKFIVSIRIDYADGTTGFDITDFNSNVGDYQCAYGVAVMKKDYLSIGYAVNYHYNANSMYIDSVFMYQDTMQSYTYDNQGNVVSTVDYASQNGTFQYKNDNLSKLMTPTGSSYEYSYDANKNLTYARSEEGVAYHVKYDSQGNAVSTGMANHSYATSIQNGKTYYLKLKSNGKYLSAYNSGTASGTNVVQAEFSGGNHQKWKVDRQTNGSYVLIPQHATGMALNVSGGGNTNGTNVQIATKASNSAQKFVITPQNDYTYVLAPECSSDGKRLTVLSSGSNNNVTILSSQGENNGDQEWYFEEVNQPVTSTITDGGIYQFRMKHSSKYLDVYNAETAVGTLLQQYEQNLKNNQRFIIRRYQNTDYYTITPYHAQNTLLEVSSDLKEYGSSQCRYLKLGDTTVTDYKLFKFEYVSSQGGFCIIPKYDETYALDVYNSGIANHTDIILTGKGTAANRIFILEPISDSITSSATYQDNGNYLHTTTDERGNTTTYTYDTGRGLQTGVTDAKGTTVTYVYNQLNDRLESVQTGVSTVSYQYETGGELKKITSPSGSIYHFIYDSFGRPKDILVGSRILSTTTYKTGNPSLVERVDYGNNNYKSYVYDNQDRLTSESVNGTTSRTYVYDKASNLVKTTDYLGNVTTKFQYDLIGRVTGIEASDGQKLHMVYDNYNRVSMSKWVIGSNAFTTGYIYGNKSISGQKNGLLYGVKVNGTERVGYQYDELTRLKNRTLNTTTPFTTTYGYLEGATYGTTTTLVKTMQNGNNTLEYSYDELGNILSVSKNGTVIEQYIYDALNQLTGAIYGGNTYTYSYDNGGNLTEVKKNGAVINSYTYGDTEWKDLLTAFNGQSITYDAIGNPLTYRNGMNFTWQNGRQLASITQNGSTLATYTYNADGLRTSKTVNGTKTDFYWMNGTLQGQKSGDAYLFFLYDESGRIFGFVEKTSTNESYYYYEFNLQGDIIGIINSAGTRVVEYTYGAWGDLLSVTGSLASSLGQTNPLRYRGYYYDAETGFYYVSSRYYDPEIGRFINADGEMEGIGGEVLGYNLFAYCFNNPINMSDPTGNWPKWVTGVLNVVVGGAQMALGATLGATVGWTGIGGVVAGFLIANGAGVATKGVAQIINHVADKKVIREENLPRKIVEDTGGLIGGDEGKKLASTAYDGVTIAANICAGATVLNANMPKILNSPIFTQNNGYGIKLGKSIEILYRNPNAAGGLGGTFFSYNGPLGKFRIDWDPTYGFHSHPPGH